MASGSMSNLSGGPDISGSGWCSQVLNVDDFYAILSWSSNFSLFSSVAGKGRDVGTGGGVVLLGQLHGLLSVSAMVGVVSCFLESATPAVLAEGNEVWIIPKSVQASLLRNSLLTSVTYTICLVSLPEAVILRMVAPRMLMLL